MNQSSTSARRLPVTSRGARTRERLLRAAESVFARRGYEDSSIAEIAMQAEAALGTFYVYFPDKKSAFVELVDELGKRLRRELAEATVGLTDRIEIERAGFAAFFRFTARHRGLYRIVRQAEFVDEEAFRRYYTDMARGYAEGLERAMDAGQIRRLDAECLAYALMGMADFLGMRFVLWADDDAAAEVVVEQAVALMERGLLPDAWSAPAPRKSEPRARGKKGKKA